MRGPVTWRSLLVVALIGGALTVLFWFPLYTGGGLIGGDIYTYFFPQKSYFADQLQAGHFPLWNNRVGHGYPLVGESQTGAFYPFHLLYRSLDVNTAYNAVQLSHYVLAFVFTWLYARRMGIGNTAGVLASVVYVYGWFPPRICLEWAIIGGTWLPAALWATESFLQRPRRRWLALLAVVLAVQLLAGHFHLAFITQLVVASYVPGRLWLAPQGVAEGVLAARRRAVLWTGGAAMLAFGLAAVQLWPTWELKRSSQRESVVGRKYEPGYGHMPARYWLQVVAPFKWYDRSFDHVSKFEEGPAQTNQIEAHLYFGLVTIVLLVVAMTCWLAGLLLGKPTYRRIDRRVLLWLLLGGMALAYTPGWHIPLTRHLPGFGFFTGPGRYGIVTTLAVAVLAAWALDWALSRGLELRSGGFPLLLVLTLFPLLAWDLWEVSRMQTYATFTEKPLLAGVEGSPIYRQLARLPGQPRLFCDYQNLPTLLKVASTPVYLGIGPAAYFDAKRAMPEPLPFGQNATPAQIDWLQRAGVTHVLTQVPLDASAWPVELLGSGPDPGFLQVAYHGGSKVLTFYLYELQGSRGRLSWLEPKEGQTAELGDYAADRVTAKVDSPDGGQVVLTDLDYPGWEVRVDGSPAETVVVDGMYRGVEVPPGKHTLEWVYRPLSVRGGAAVSLSALLLLGGVCIAPRRRFGLGLAFDAQHQPEPQARVETGSVET